MASTSKYGLSNGEIEDVLREQLSDSDESLLDSDGDLGDVDDIAVQEVLGLESYTSDSAQNCNVPVTANTFRWENMSNYVGQIEQFIGNPGPQNEAVGECNGVKVFRMFFTDELVELIVRETNIYAEQRIRSRGLLLPLRSRMRDWKPVTKDEIYRTL